MENKLREILLRIIKQSKLSQKKFAKNANVAEQYISNVLRGRAAISFKYFLQLILANGYKENYTIVESENEIIFTLKLTKNA